MSLRQVVAAFAARVGHPGRKLVLLKLADNANDEGICWPSIARIAHETELSRDSVKRHIAALEADGFVAVRRRRKDGVNLPSIYELQIEQGRCIQHPPPADSTAAGVGAYSTYPVQPAPGVGAVCTSEPPSEPSTTTTTTTTADGDGGGVAVALARDEETDLRAALEAQAYKLGKADPLAWAGSALRRIRRDGVDADAAALLAAWRRAEATKAAREAQLAAERQARDDAPPPSRETGRRGLAKAKAAMRGQAGEVAA